MSAAKGSAVVCSYKAQEEPAIIEPADATPDPADPRMFSQSLTEDVRYLNEDIHAVAEKVDDPVLCQKIAQYVAAPFEIQEQIRRDAGESGSRRGLQPPTAMMVSSAALGCRSLCYSAYGYNIAAVLVLLGVPLAAATAFYHPSLPINSALTAVTENHDLLVVILRSPEVPALSRPQMQRVFKASRAYREYKAQQAEWDDSDDEGPDNDDAWLFEDLNVLMKLMERKKEKEAMISLIFEVGSDCSNN